MTDYASFMPKVLPIHVGGVELDAQELTIAKRDAALKIVLTGLDVATFIKPFWDAAKSKQDLDLVAISGKLKDTLLRVLGDDLTTISCLTLDTPQNRKKVAVLLSSPEAEKVEQEKNFGYVYSPVFFAWARENLTARQEYRLIEAMLEINDFVGLIKNYATLVTATMKAAREKQEAKK
jgi:hypothetical protein